MQYKYNIFYYHAPCLFIDVALLCVCPSILLPWPYLCVLCCQVVGNDHIIGWDDHCCSFLSSLHGLITAVFVPGAMPSCTFFHHMLLEFWEFWCFSSPLCWLYCQSFGTNLNHLLLCLHPGVHSFLIGG